jgi:trehalose 6-phosphate synthase
MARPEIADDEALGIRLWSKASLLHFGRDPVTRELVAKAPSGGFVQVVASPGTLHMYSVNANWHALGSRDDIDASGRRAYPIPRWQHYVDLGSHTDGFLNFSNHFAWPLQHGLIEQLNESLDQFDLDSTWNDFVAGSEIYAHELAKHAQIGETQLLHDNHLWLVPAMFRTYYPEIAEKTPIGFIIHTPHAVPLLFEKFLGTDRAQKVTEGIDAADFVTFQSDADMRNFMECRREFLFGELHAQLRATHVQLDPVDIEQVAGLRAVPTDYLTEHDEELLRKQRRHARSGMRMVEMAKRKMGPGSKVIVGSMRLDPAKGALELAQALGALVRTHAEYLGKLHVILRVPESRPYDYYRVEVDSAITLANQRYLNECRKHGITPKLPLIRRYKLNSRGAAIGATRFADVAVYPSLADGYNISAVEAAVAADVAAIVLGESAGVAKTLGEDTLTCDPNDIEELATTLHIALCLPASIRQERLHRMRGRINNSSKVQWLLDRTKETNAAYWSNRAAAEAVAKIPHTAAS